MEEIFKNLYSDIFDEKGNIKNCGRNKCKELIVLANSLEPNISHGNKKTGFMKTESIKSLRNKFL